MTYALQLMIVAVLASIITDFIVLSGKGDEPFDIFT